MSKQRPPILAKELLPSKLETFDGAELEAVRVDACNVTQQRAERVRFDTARLVGCELSETKATTLSWVDVECERSGLSLSEWPAAKLTRVVFRDCRVTGARWLDSELEDVRFVDCQLDYAGFSGARLRRVSFERCRLRDADFSNADLNGTAFLECDLHGVDFVGAKLTGADVRSSSLSEVRVHARDLRGLIVNPEQAAVLAQLFGLVVRDA